MTSDPRLAPLSVPARPEATSNPSQRVGVLLSHGFTGSPASMRPWGEFLALKGYAVEAPRLPGHGTSWEEMNTTTWDDWYAEVTRAFEKLRDENDKVIVGGLSMGGALALQLAADHPDDVRGLLLVNPAVASSNKQLLAVPLVKRFLASMPGIGNDIKKPGMDELGYDRTPLHALHSMTQAWKGLRRDLPRVVAPIRLFRSAIDHVVDPSSARIIAASVGSHDVTERSLRNSYHVATIDNDAPVIFEESAEFIHAVVHPLRPDNV